MTNSSWGEQRHAVSVVTLCQHVPPPAPGESRFSHWREKALSQPHPAASPRCMEALGGSGNWMASIDLAGLREVAWH